MTNKNDLIHDEYYWIILNRELCVGLFNAHYESWTICGTEEIYGIDDIEKIIEHIKRPT